jgi:uncharacterized protein YunC (DUF1805 family)
MIHEKITLSQKQADGYIIPCGRFNLVVAITDKGMAGCGAFDVAALDNFNYPAVKVKPAQGSSITNLEDLLAGITKEVNNTATKLGISIGMTGKEALEKM